MTIRDRVLSARAKNAFRRDVEQTAAALIVDGLRAACTSGSVTVAGKAGVTVDPRRRADGTVLLHIRQPVALSTHTGVQTCTIGYTATVDGLHRCREVPTSIPAAVERFRTLRATRYGLEAAA